MKTSFFALSVFVLATSVLACDGKEQFSYCVGDHVINSNGLEGTVSGIAEKGFVMVKYPNNSLHRLWSTSHLAVTKGCSPTDSHYCVNDRVINSNGKEGTISGIFQTGFVTVTYADDHNNYTWTTSHLIRIEGCAEKRRGE